MKLNYSDINYDEVSKIRALPSTYAAIFLGNNNGKIYNNVNTPIPCPIWTAGINTNIKGGSAKMSCVEGGDGSNYKCVDGDGMQINCCDNTDAYIIKKDGDNNLTCDSSTTPIPSWQCDKNTFSCNSTLKPDGNKAIFYKESTCENNCIGKWYCDDPTKNKCKKSLTRPSDLPVSCAREIGKGTPKNPTGDFIGYDTEKECQFKCFKPFLTHGNPPAGCVNGDIGFCDEVSSISGDIPGNSEPKGNIPYVGYGQSCECKWFSTNGQTYGDQYGGCGSTNPFWHKGYWTAAIRCVPGTKAHSYSSADTEHVWCE